MRVLFLEISYLQSLWARGINERINWFGKWKLNWKVRSDVFRTICEKGFESHYINHFFREHLVTNPITFVKHSTSNNFDWILRLQPKKFKRMLLIIPRNKSKPTLNFTYKNRMEAKVNKFLGKYLSILTNQEKVSRKLNETYETRSNIPKKLNELNETQKKKFNCNYFADHF